VRNKPSRMWNQEFESVTSGDCWADRRQLARSVLQVSTARWLHSLRTTSVTDVSTGLFPFYSALSHSVLTNVSAGFLISLTFYTIAMFICAVDTKSALLNVST